MTSVSPTTHAAARPARAERAGARIADAFVDAIGWTQALERIEKWARQRTGYSVCLCNAHSVVESKRDPTFAAALASADLVLPDGAPVAWMLRRLGFAGQPRVSGPDLMLALCERFEADGLSIFLYGSTPATLARLEDALRGRFPRLRIAGAIAPPFGPVSPALLAEHMEVMNGSGAGAVFVGLGCPRQEKWLAANRAKLQAVALGVGAAFDFHAGTIARAPRWMRHSGLEWLHRLASEPRRLWKRYLVTNTLFIVSAAGQLMRGARVAPSEPPHPGSE